MTAVINIKAKFSCKERVTYKQVKLQINKITLKNYPLLLNIYYSMLESLPPYKVIKLYTDSPNAE